MSRVNPRSVLLAALQEGPRAFAWLWVEVHKRCVLTSQGTPPRWRKTGQQLAARHLCHLIRGGYVKRLADGHYVLTERYRRRCQMLEWESCLNLNREGPMDQRRVVVRDALRRLAR